MREPCKKTPRMFSVECNSPALPSRSFSFHWVIRCKSIFKSARKCLLVFPLLCCTSHFDVIHITQYMQWCVIGSWLEFACFHRRGNKIHLIQSFNDIIHIVTAKRTKSAPTFPTLWGEGCMRNSSPCRPHTTTTSIHICEPKIWKNNQSASFLYIFQQDNWFLLLLLSTLPLTSDTFSFILFNCIDVFGRQGGLGQFFLRCVSLTGICNHRSPTTTLQIFFCRF